jgi:hypothetical protein
MKRKLFLISLLASLSAPAEFKDGNKLLSEMRGTTMEQIINDNNIKLSTTAIKQQVLDTERYELDMKNYKDRISTMAKELGLDLYREFNVEDNPKKDRCFTLAYNCGGQYGPQGVYDCFEKFVTLIKD